MAASPAPTNVKIKGSPSLLCNNLSVDAKFSCHVHVADVVIASTRPDLTAPKECQRLGSNEPLMQVKLCNIGGVSFVVMAGLRSVQVWDPDQRNRLFLYTLPAPTTASEEHENFACGITHVSEGGETFLLVGRATGEILVFGVDKFKFLLDRSLTTPKHTVPITELSSQHQTSGSGAHFASADLNGGITVWRSAGWTPLCTFDGAGAPCTSLRIRGNLICASFLTGHLRMFNVEARKKVAEICAHSRTINAIELHPMRDLVRPLVLCPHPRRLPVGEDGAVIVWNLERLADKEITTALVASAPDCLLTGVAFSNDGSQVVATSYDHDELKVWQCS